MMVSTAVALALQVLLFALISKVLPAPVLSSPSTACGDIVNSCNFTFTAKQAYDCLISVPFNPAVATRFIQYYNDTIQFHSTLPYLKDPPTSYQQPRIDVAGGLEEIQSAIDRGAFANQYAFEATLQKLASSVHDAHFQIEAGILSAFNFYSPYSMVSLSLDGLQNPKVYVADDVSLAQDPNSTFAASAISKINGQEAISYLRQFGAENSVGHLEPHADWNDLMSSFANYIQDDYSLLESYVSLYPGETMTLEFENRTKNDPAPWYADYISPGPTGPLSTGGDFYNFFILGFYPASYDADSPDPCSFSLTSSQISTATNSSNPASATVTSWANTAYPSVADVHQPNLYPSGGGFVTGYFLHDISTAVLSIPTFEMNGNDTRTFSDTIDQFLKSSRTAGIKKILIDLQGNTGGDSLLAVDTFKHFFPSNDTFRGSRLRAHSTANVLGDTFTAYFTADEFSNSSDYDIIATSEWVATDRLNVATDQNFTSWGEYYGPHEFHGDFFTSVQRENISSAVFDENALGIDIYGAATPATTSQLYLPENVAILTDGLCSSACAVFLEMMHYDADVQVVVAGGLPLTGPMQASGGSRGAQVYSSDQIDDDIAVAEYFNPTTSDIFPNRTQDVFITYISVNLRDQIREDDNTPTQFLYDPADCRIFYTADTWYDFSKLWAHAASAIWEDTSLCVPGSTRYSSNKTTKSSAPQNPNVANFNATALSDTIGKFTTEFSGLQLDSLGPPKGSTGRSSAQSCRSNSDCASGQCRGLHPPSHRIGLANSQTLTRGICSSVTTGGGPIGRISRLREPVDYPHRRARR